MRKKNQINLHCAYCHLPFSRSPSKLENSKSGIYFCSRICKDTAQKLSNGRSAIQPAHYGTGTCKETYRRIGLAALPHVCNRCGYNKHIQVLAVHHKDRNKTNNTIENLELLCHNCHAEEHLLNG